MIEVFFDGACWPNPDGVGTWSFVIKEDGKTIKFDSGQCLTKKVTNNVAEYIALGFALKWLSENGYQNHKIDIKGDSQLVLNQIGGTWQCNHEHLRKLRDRCQELLELFNGSNLIWIKGELNSEADSLSKAKWEEINQKPFPDLRKRK